MHKYLKLYLIVCIGAVLFSGCAITPIRREINLPPQDLTQQLTDDSKVRLIIFNNSNKFWYGLDGSGKINVSFDGKGVCRLGIGEYVILETDPGKHIIILEHKDMGHFASSHIISVTQKYNYIQIFATPASNEAGITTKPESFEKSYNPVKF